MNPSTYCFFLTLAGLALIVAETSASIANSNEGNSFKEEGKNLSILIVLSCYIAHQFPLIALGEELISRGHRVGMIGPVVEGVSTLPDIPVSKGIEFYNGGSVSEEEYRVLMNGFKNNTNLITLIYNVSKALLNQSSENHMISLRKAIDKLDSSEWDFIVTDAPVVTVMHYIMKKWYTDKVIVNFSPLPMLPSFAPPWTFPKALSGFTDNMNFKERFLNALLFPIETLAILFVSSFAIPEEKQKTDLDMFTSGGHVYPVLVNTVIGFEYPKTIMPLVHYIGPLLSGSPAPLSPDLQQWLQKCPERSVVYISMGTSAELTSELASEIIAGTNQYRIVWSLRRSNQGILSDLSLDSERIFISEWISQLALLQHPAVAMSIMHCAASVQESLYYSIPVICIPHGAEQFEIAVRVKSLGLGIRIFTQDLTRERVADAVKAIENGPYYANAQKLAKIFRMAGGREKAADLVELYAEVGHQHGVPAYIKYKWSWVQYYNVDVQAVIVIILMGMCWTLMKLFKCCCRCCTCPCWQKKTMKLKTN